MELIPELFVTCLPILLAAVFHMFVIRYNWFSFFLYPLDHFRKLNGKRIFGDNKTYRGLFVMNSASILFCFLFELSLSHFPILKQYNLLLFDQYSFTVYGLVFGMGYILGELPNSLIKRQLDIKEGKTKGFIQSFVDMLDSIVLLSILLLFISNFEWKHVLGGMLFYGLLHLSINYSLFLLKVRKEPF
jgi:CDP-diglyceride synthetase